jgi:hypothetical protein
MAITAGTDRSHIIDNSAGGGMHFLEASKRSIVFGIVLDYYATHYPLFILSLQRNKEQSKNF